MIGDLVLRGVSVGTVVEDAPNDTLFIRNTDRKKLGPRMTQHR